MVGSSAFAEAFGIMWAVAEMIATGWLLRIMRGHTTWQPYSLLARLSLPLIVVIALVVRLIPTVILDRGAHYDINSYWIVGSLVLSGHDVYRDPAAFGHYPYLPGSLWLSALAKLLSARFELPFVVLVKLPSVVADSFMPACLSSGLLRRGASRPLALACGLVYALNPISMMVTAFHGQFDAIPLLGCVVAWSLMPSGDRQMSRVATVGAGLALGTAILAKTWPLLLVPAFVYTLRSWSHRITFAGLALAVPAIVTGVYVAFYHSPVSQLAGTTLGYNSIEGWWGPGLAFTIAYHLRLMTITQIHPLSQMTDALVFVGVLVYLWRTRHGEITQACLFSLLIFMIISAGFSVQYLMWIVPFVIVDSIVADGPLIIFMALCSAAMLFDYMTGTIYDVGGVHVGFFAESVAFLPIYVALVWTFVTRIEWNWLRAPWKKRSLGMSAAVSDRRE